MILACVVPGGAICIEIVIGGGTICIEIVILACVAAGGIFLLE